MDHHPGEVEQQLPGKPIQDMSGNSLRAQRARTSGLPRTGRAPVPFRKPTIRRSGAPRECLLPTSP